MRRALLAFYAGDFAAAVIAGRAHVVTPMHFARHRLDRQGWVFKGIVRAMHAAFRGGFFILLNSHFTTPV